MNKLENWKDTVWRLDVKCDNLFKFNPLYKKTTHEKYTAPSFILMVINISFKMVYSIPEIET